VVDGARVEHRPSLPADWPGYTLRWQPPSGGTLEVVVRLEGRATTAATLDGAPLAVERGAVVIPIPRDAGDHRVEVMLGRDVGARYEGR
jgi:cyclic beta-1,2-glucan synthetase